MTDVIQPERRPQGTAVVHAPDAYGQLHDCVVHPAFLPGRNVETKGRGVKGHAGRCQDEQ